MLRVAGFAGAPILSALAPFLILPVIPRVVDAEGWASFSAGQAIGILGMVAVLFGWSVIGPVRVARSTDTHERAVILRESLASRAITAAVALPAVGTITFLVAGDSHRADAVAVAVAVAVGGFSPAWFCIGEGNPKALMVFDAVPKLAASAIALPLVASTGLIFWYPLALVTFTLPTFAVHALLVLRGHDPAGEPARGVGVVLRTLVPTAAIDAAGNAYGSTPVPIAASGLSASDAGAFASADRVYRLGLLAVIAIGNAFQAWVLAPAATNRRQRHLLAICVQVTLGILGGATIAIAGPWATALVFSDSVAAPPVTCLLFGIAFLFISSGTPLIRNLLIPAGRVRLVFTATLASAAVGVTVMLCGAFLASESVIASGIASAEAVSFLILLGPAIRELRRESTADHPAAQVPGAEA